MRIPQQRTRRLLFVTIPVMVVVVAVATAFWSAQRALSHSADLASTHDRLRITLRPIDTAAAQASNLPFEPVAAPDDFTSGAVLDGTFYLAGPGGLTILAPDGTRRLTLRTGFELPVAPIVAVATGRLRGMSETKSSSQPPVLASSSSIPNPRPPFTSYCPKSKMPATLPPSSQCRLETSSLARVTPESCYSMAPR